MGRLIVAVDLHGVICDHPPAGKGATEPDWPEVPGAVEWLLSTSARYDVHVVSARFSRGGQEGAEALAAARAWLIAHGVPSAWMLPIGGRMPRIWLSAHKPPCLLWVDDRGFCFRGAFPSVEQIESFRPWNR